MPELLTLWQKGKTLALAGEIASASLVAGDFNAGKAAATFMMERLEQRPSPARDLAKTILGEDNVVLPMGLPATSIRAALRADVRDPLGWCNLARFHATIGLHSKARREMAIALGLAKENRYILRVASRCFLHLGERDRALQVLNLSRLSRRDPWVAASLISAHSIIGKSPRKIQEFRNLAMDANYSPSHRAELLAALGTLEIESGNERKAKKLIAHSLMSPNENVVAQGLWATRNHFAVHVDDRLLAQPYAFEAKTMSLIQRGDWEDALSEAEKWRLDEPFAGRPAVEVSFIKAIVFRDFSGAVDVLKPALRANPNDLLVANNLAFSLAALGRTKEAITAFPLQKFEGARNELKVILLATAGMIEFRRGNLAIGRHLYQSAARLAERLKDYAQRSLVLGYHALEEERAGGADVEGMKQEAAKDLSKYTGPLHQLLRRQVVEGAHLKLELSTTLPDLILPDQNPPLRNLL